MTAEVGWIEPKMVPLRGKLRPNFLDDDRFTATWWEGNISYAPRDHQWRSYVRRGEEVARILLSLRFPSHSFDLPRSAMMIWNFEVREDLRCSGAHLGTTIVNQLVAEYRDREIYIGPTAESETFWTRFGWPMCNCDECRGRDYIVRRPT